VHSDDDQPIGRLLSRREILHSFGAAAALATLPGIRLHRTSARRPACLVRPAQTEGPYFVDRVLERSDIRADPTDGSVPDGTPFFLTFMVSRMDGASCAPLPGVLVDIWQCDAVGVYSGVKDINGLFDTTGKQFLRGHQRTDPAGQARFRTIFPGWYQGRTVHIHFKIRTAPEAERGYDFTSQLYFDDAVGDRVFAAAPYNANRQRRTLNPGDRIFREARGAELVLPVERRNGGYEGRFEIGLVLS